MILYTPGRPPIFTDADALPKPGAKTMTDVATIEAATKADVAALEARVKVLETDAEAAYQNLKAIGAKAVAFAKTGGGIGVVGGLGYAAAKFDVIGFILKHVL